MAVMDYGRGPWELVMVRTTRQMPLKLCSDCQFEGELETTRNEFVHLLLSSTIPLFPGRRISLLSQNQFAATPTLSACKQALRFGGNGV